MMKVQMMQTFSMIPSPILKNASQKFLLTANYQMKFLKKNQTILTIQKINKIQLTMILLKKSLLQKLIQLFLMETTQTKHLVNRKKHQKK